MDCERLTRRFVYGQCVDCKREDSLNNRNSAWNIRSSAASASRGESGSISRNRRFLTMLFRERCFLEEEAEFMRTPPSHQATVYLFQFQSRRFHAGNTEFPAIDRIRNPAHAMLGFPSGQTTDETRLNTSYPFLLSFSQTNRV